MTNLEYIKSMNDKQIAEWILFEDKTEHCEMCPYLFDGCAGESCVKAMIKWLNSEHKDKNYN